MEALDGNAIAGPLFEYFGREMTTAVGICAHCGTTAQIAELVVFIHAPGTIVRCRSCGNVAIALVRIRAQLQVDTSAFQMDQTEARPRA